MFGAIIGDIIGSVYEFSPIKTKVFPLFSRFSHPTDDSVMTVAVACACADTLCRDIDLFKRAAVLRMNEAGRLYPDAGYGGRFSAWLKSEVKKPYNSFGNGSAMRVSAVAWSALDLAQAELYAKLSAEVTHNHPEGIKGAQAAAAAVFLARAGKSKKEIKAYIEKNYYKLDFTLDGIRDKSFFDVTCQGSVPQALVCFLEADSFEDAVRNAVSLGGDADTQAAIAGAAAEAYFGIPEDIMQAGLSYLDDFLLSCCRRWFNAFFSGKASFPRLK